MIVHKQTGMLQHSHLSEWCGNLPLGPGSARFWDHKHRMLMHNCWFSWCTTVTKGYGGRSISAYTMINFANTWKDMAPLKLFPFGEFKTLSRKHFFCIYSQHAQLLNHICQVASVCTPITPYSPYQTTAWSVQLFWHGQWHIIHRCYTVQGLPIHFPQNLPLTVGYLEFCRLPHVAHRSLCTPYSISQTVCWSSQPFLARDVINTSRAYATMSVSVCLSVCDGSALWSWCMLGTLQLRQPAKLKWVSLKVTFVVWNLCNTYSS